MESFISPGASSQKETPSQGNTSTSKAPEKKKRRAASYKEKMEYQRLEEEIDRLEKEKAEIEYNMNNGRYDSQQMPERSQRLGEVMDELDRKTDRYLELSEIIESNQS